MITLRTVCRKISAGLEIFLILLPIIALVMILPVSFTPDSPPQTGAAPLPQTGSSTSYLPIIYRQPTPNLPSILYQDNFSDDDSGWRERSSGSCQSLYTSGIYGTLAEEDQQCEFPAPDEAEYNLGAFQVKARHYQGSTDFSYGLYINGQNEDRYLFKIHFRDDDRCQWQLIRREGGDEQAIQAGDCRSAAEEYDRFNTLKLNHGAGGRLSAYLNNHLLGSYQDNSPLIGRGTGLYLSEDADEQDVTVIFDNFTVYRPQ